MWIAKQWYQLQKEIYFSKYGSGYQFLIIKELIIIMYSSELSLLSSTYQNIASKYPKGIQNLNSPSLESFLMRIIIHVSDNRSETNISLILNNIKQNHSWLFVSNLLLRELTRQLSLGHGSTSKNTEQLPIDVKKQLSFQERTDYAQFIDFTNLSKQFNLQGTIPENISMYNQQYLTSPVFALFNKPYLTKQLSIEGETWISTTPYPHLLLTLKQVIRHLVNDQTFDEPYKLLIQARISLIQNLILDKPVGSLVDEALGNFKKYFQITFRSKSISTFHYINLQMEYFNALLFTYKYTEAETILQQCKKVLNIDIQFTGKLGRRTKFQQFDTVQLVMNITQFKEKQNPQTEDIPTEELNIIPASDLLVLDKKYIQPSAVSLQEDSILFAKPKLNQEEKEIQIDVLKQLVITNIIYYMYETTPKDEILFLKINSMLIPLLESKLQMPYAIHYSLLTLRSLNELPRYKNSDRALEQLQQLVNGYDKIKDSDDVFTLSIPFGYRLHLVFLKLVAEKVMSFGLMMTGVEMYQKAGMYQQCVEGLLSAGHKTKALELGKKLLDEQGNDPSPYLLCLLGDGTNQISYYQKSWKQSNGTYARAQRTLGRIYFYKKQFQKSIQAFKKSLEINFYNPSSWFTLGCAYLNLNQFADGAKAFSQSISIDDSQGQGWGNLASCFIGQKKINEAYGALSQALKYSQSNWKLWQNMMGTSLKVKKFYKFMECINKLISIDSARLITEEILQKLNQILEYRTTLLTVQRKRVTYTYKNRIDATYEKIKQSMGEKAYVWRQYAQYLLLKIEYLKSLETIYTDLHVKNQVDPNDMIDGYEDASIIKEFTQESISQIEKEVVECKQKQLNMSMILGWEADKQKRNQVKKILEQYKQKYTLYSNGEDDDFTTFVKSVDQKIKASQES